MAFTQAPCCRDKHAVVSKQTWIFLPKDDDDDDDGDLQQKLCDLKMAVGAGVMKRNEAAAEARFRIRRQIQAGLFLSQRCVSPFVLGVNVGPVLEEELNDADSVVAGSQVERRGLEEKRAG